MFHRFPRNEEKRKTWTSLISKGRSGFISNDGSRIYSNHFKDGQPTTKNPNPTLWLTIQYSRENKVLYKRNPSEKEFLLKMWWQMKKRQGRKHDKTCTPHDNKIDAILSSPECKSFVVPPLGKRAPERKLSLEQEYLLVLIRLRLGLLIKDLTFRFQVLSARVS